jgi:hypothetical protein
LLLFALCGVITCSSIWIFLSSNRNLVLEMLQGFGAYILCLNSKYLRMRIGGFFSLNSIHSWSRTLWLLRVKGFNSLISVGFDIRNGMHSLNFVISLPLEGMFLLLWSAHQLRCVDLVHDRQGSNFNCFVFPRRI